MTESQNHGFLFQQQITDDLLTSLNLIGIQSLPDTLQNFIQNNLHSASYTAKWDIPDIAPEIPPISIKSFQFKAAKSTVEFGDIKRIFSIDHDFILVLVGYDQDGEIKRVAFSDCLYIQPTQWDSLKGSLSLNDIDEFNTKLRSFAVGQHHEARRWSKPTKAAHKHKSKFDIRFKIDSKSQRRIQCALQLGDLYAALGLPLHGENKIGLSDISSPPRKRNSNTDD